MKLSRSTLLRYTFLTFLLVFAGLLLVSCRKGGSATKPADVDYYTCTMHPSVKKQSPTDKCPICSMDLVPVKKKGVGALENSHAPDASRSNAPDEFTVPVRRLQQIGVTYAAVEKRSFQHSIR